MDSHNEYMIVIDTDSYSGNFERQMCAFITGQIGECEVGNKEAQIAKSQLSKKDITWFEDHVMLMPDEHGCHRPCAIRPTPGIWNDGMGNHYTETDDEAMVRERHLKSVVEFFSRSPNDPQSKKSIDEAKKSGPGKYLAYQSVEIYLDAIPSPKMKANIEKRARLYVETHCGRPVPIIVTAVRIIKKVISEEEV